MATPVDVCNLALSRIGAKRIAALTDATAEGRECKLHYPFCRDAVLEDHDWSFARKRVLLSLLEDEVDGWEYIYQYPSDCISARELYKGSPSSGTDPYEFEIGLSDDGSYKRILTNTEEATLVYTSRVDDVTLFTYQYMETLAWRLAANLAITLRGKLDLRNTCMQQYELEKAKAKALNANEEQRKPDEVNTFVNARKA